MRAVRAGQARVSITPKRPAEQGRARLDKGGQGANCRVTVSSGRTLEDELRQPAEHWHEHHRRREHQEGQHYERGNHPGRRRRLA